jgi:hypothetical protein
MVSQIYEHFHNQQNRFPVMQTPVHGFRIGTPYERYFFACGAPMITEEKEL